MQKSLIGIDVGTSAVKCVVSADGHIIDTASAPLSVQSPAPGWSEQNPDDWIGAVKSAVARLTSPLDQVAGLALSGQMHGAVMLDAAAKPVRPCILWNDSRANNDCTTLRSDVPEIGQIAGVLPLPGFTAPKLMWVRREEPHAFDAIRHLLLPKDYVGLWLTGEFATDVSDAAGTLWLDEATRGWSDTLIGASGIDRSWLPELHHGFDQVGSLRRSVAEAMGLPAGLPVFAGGGDAATGAVSLGAAAAGRGFISLGTSGQFLVVDDSYQPNPDQYVHAFCHTLPGLWYRMAAMLNGARPLSWFASVLGISVETLLTEAAHADVTRVPLFLPYLTGERSPHGDPDVRAAFYDIDDATGRPEMCRAVVEAIAFMMRDAADSFGSDAMGGQIIPVIGGGSQSDLVLQTLANMLEQPVARSASGQGGAALGAALLAEVGVGLKDPVSLSFAPELTQAFTPKPEGPLAERLARFRSLYAVLRGGL